MYTQSFRKNWCFLTFVWILLVLNIMPHFPKHNALSDFRNWASRANPSFSLSWAVAPLLLLICCCKRRQPEGLGTRFAPVPEGGEGVIQSWGIEGAHPEDRVSALSLSREAWGFHGNWARLGNYTVHKNKKMSIFNVYIKHLYLIHSHFRMCQIYVYQWQLLIPKTVWIPQVSGGQNLFFFLKFAKLFHQINLMHKYL